MMIGINDICRGKSVDEIFANYKKIVTKLVDNGMELYTQSTILAGRPGKRWERYNKKIMVLNERLQVLAQQTDSVTYIDLNVGLTQDSLLKTAYSLDGMHLNGDGYAIWKEIITPYIQNNVQSRQCKYF